LSVKSIFAATMEASALQHSTLSQIDNDAGSPETQLAVEEPALSAHSSDCAFEGQVSSWSQSRAKRLFDFACVFLSLPLIIPILLLIGLAVRLTSSGPVLFLQKRTGRHDRTFTIVKFRTLLDTAETAHPAVTTTGNQQFTPLGPFLRRWKLDELPQLLNVLAGDMSLVGARPKLPEHQISALKSRPGITGAATIAFACEETILASVPKHLLDGYYREVILPAKHQLDSEYMANASFLSDLKLLSCSVLRRWDSSTMKDLLKTDPLAVEEAIGDIQLSKAPVAADSYASMSLPPAPNRPDTAKQIAAFR
jgi:lipopolysaccharide/colanic/teichoic acid biosynthesis glycosyltransferase